MLVTVTECKHKKLSIDADVYQADAETRMRKRKEWKK